MRALIILTLLSLLACAAPNEYRYTRITQQGASWYSNEVLVRLDSSLVLHSETTELTDTFKGVWYGIDNVQTFRGIYPPIVAMIAPEWAMIIWPDGMISHLTRNP